MKQNKKFNHLEFEQRQILSEGVMNGKSFTKIAQEVGVSRTTVARELQRNRKAKMYQDSNGRPCECINLDKCNHIRCKGRVNCEEYEALICPLREKRYVCHGCHRFGSCRNITYYYSAKNADIEYRDNLVKSRSGIKASIQEIALIDDIFSDRIKHNKQSPYHVFVENEHLLPVSLSTIYRYISAGILKTRYVDLPKAIYYSVRQKKIVYNPTDIAYRNGRTYNDFLQFVALALPSDIVQMDTVIGKRNEKEAILTLLFEKSNFLVAIKLHQKNSLNVHTALRLLYKRLGQDNYKKLFHTILTDNGPEFQAPSLIDVVDQEGELISSVYYCDPYKSNQKAKIENVHRLIRRIIPKGISIKNLTQHQLTDICNNINSIKRKTFEGLSAYSCFTTQYGVEIANLLGASQVPEKEVCISPLLIK